jgi:hypothetical protein
MQTFEMYCPWHLDVGELHALGDDTVTALGRALDATVDDRVLVG